MTKKKNSYKKIVFLIIPLVALVILGTIFLFLKKEKQLHSSEKELVILSQEIPSDWKTIVDTKVGLEVMYPPSWYAVIQPASDLNLNNAEIVYSRISLLPPVQQPVTQVDIVYEKCARSYQKSCEERLEEISNNVKNNSRGFTTKKIKVNNNIGLQITTEGTLGGGEDMPIEASFIPIGENLLSVSSAQNSTNQYHDQILSSIRFVEEN